MVSKGAHPDGAEEKEDRKRKERGTPGSTREEKSRTGRLFKGLSDRVARRTASGTNRLSTQEWKRIPGRERKG